MHYQSLLPHLYYFWMVSTHNSFSKAAEKLHVSQSAISYQIKQLEDKLKMTLILRGKGSELQFTTEGKKLLQQCNSMFRYVEEMIHSLKDNELKGKLVVTSTLVFGDHIVTPFIAHLKKHYPDFNVEIILTDDVIDFYKSDIDLAIRFHFHPPINDFDYQKIGSTTRILVAATDYLQKAPPLKKLEDIKQHRFVLSRKHGFEWAYFQGKLTGFELPPNESLVQIDSGHGMVSAVRAGLGLGILPMYAVMEDMKNKKLKPILKNIFPTIEAPFFICRPKLAYESKKISCFVREFQAYLRQQQFKQAIHVHQESVN